MYYLFTWEFFYIRSAILLLLWVCQAPVLLRVTTDPREFMRDAEVEDQTPAASLVSQVVAKLHVAAQLARACRDSVLGADLVSSRAEERAKGRYHPVVRLE
jgi:hypothetical protein